MDAELRIVLLGKTGIGKSSFANTIFGERVFKTNPTANSGTSDCQKATRSVGGRNVTLIDTPGFFDNRLDDRNLKSKIAECVTMCSPGPHAFLILLEVKRFTEQENEVISRIKKLFSAEAFRFAVVVFTHGEQLEEGMRIEEFMRGNQYLCDLLKNCGGRYCVVDNKYWNNNPRDDYRNNQVQVENLLRMINQMVDGNNGFYTNKMLQTVENLKERVTEKLKRLFPNWPLEHVAEQARVIVSVYLRRLAGLTTGMLLGALLGVGIMVTKVVQIMMGNEEQIGPIIRTIVPIGDTGAAIGEAVSRTAATLALAGPVGVVGAAAGGAVAGATLGGCVGYLTADESDSVFETVRNTATAVTELAVQTPLVSRLTYAPTKQGH